MGPAALAAIQSISAAGSEATSMCPPLHRAVSQSMNSKIPNEIPSIGEIIQLYTQMIIGEGEARKLLLQHGLNEDGFDALFKLATPKLSIGDAIVAERRGINAPDTLEEAVRKSGMNEMYAEVYRKLSEYFPSPDDLIRFAVREVYTPQTREAYGADQDFPEAFKTEGAKAGLSEEMAHNYWAAHWNLPSITQGFEMLHRQLITEDELLKLLTAQDVMPVWRDRLMKISYNPLTRVDIRRAYALGVVTIEQVYKAYRDDGYNDENATIITNFISADVSQELHGASRSLVVTSYKEGVIDKATATELLTSLNTGDTAIALILAEADYDILITKLKEAEKTVTEQIKQGQIGIDVALATLQALDAPSTWLTLASQRLTRAKASIHKMPTLADLKRWLKGGLIPESMFLARTESLGYTPGDANLYLAEVKAGLTPATETAQNG